LTQKESAGQIERAMTDLREAARHISEKAQDQNRGGLSLKTGIEGTNASLGASLDLVGHIGVKTGEMLRVFDRVRAAFDRTQDINEELRDLMHEEKDPRL
ncbi:MAG: hypothetical protein JXA95_08255, partial [Spirochaetales bacterium]|nr:hypothetical protein [Spirochaetales bacterium]